MSALAVITGILVFVILIGGIFFGVMKIKQAK
jgi:hypothetical protein